MRLAAFLQSALVAPGSRQHVFRQPISPSLVRLSSTDCGSESSGDVSSTIMEPNLVTGNRTRYTIDDSTCPPVEYDVLKKIVSKHCTSLSAYLSNRPIAEHTREAFHIAKEFVESRPQSKIILDSGCGTGRSTLLLSEMNPDHVVIGIDRSLARLNRNAVYRTTFQERIESDCNNDAALSDENVLAITTPDRPNLLIIRAELSNFWRCAIDSGWSALIHKHYLLYPNPYPKNSRLKSRWHAHPSFPLILQLGGDVVVRSNWEGYLNQFASAVLIASDEVWSSDDDKNVARKYSASALNGPKKLECNEIPLTNFEKKYFDCGERVYELILQQDEH